MYAACTLPDPRTSALLPGDLLTPASDFIQSLTHKAQPEDEVMDESGDGDTACSSPTAKQSKANELLASLDGGRSSRNSSVDSSTSDGAASKVTAHDEKVNRRIQACAKEGLRKNVNPIDYWTDPLNKSKYS